jgi:hypothetical protein
VPRSGLVQMSDEDLDKAFGESLADAWVEIQDKSFRDNKEEEAKAISLVKEWEKFMALLGKRNGKS